MSESSKFWNIVGQELPSTTMYDLRKGDIILADSEVTRGYKRVTGRQVRDDGTVVLTFIDVEPDEEFDRDRIIVVTDA